MKLTIFAAVAASAALYGCSSEAGASTSQSQEKNAVSGFDSMPSDVLYVLPKDGILAIWKPTFVAAAKADMPADAEVIGVAYNGEAHAYSINLLDGHEIVNDVVGGRKIAATW